MWNVNCECPTKFLIFFYNNFATKKSWIQLEMTTIYPEMIDAKIVKRQLL